MRTKYLSLVALSAASLVWLGSASAQATAGWSAEMCSTGGCTDIEPTTAVMLIALAQLEHELNSKKPFGPNGEIVKQIHNMLEDLQHGPGPNNSLRNAAEDARHDLVCGPGPNNDVVKILAQLGIKITTSSGNCT